MIRAAGSRHGRPLVMLGLDDENLMRLPQDEPIMVNLRDLVPGGPPTELPDIDIVLFHVNPISTAMLAGLDGLSAEDREDLEGMWQ